MESLCFGAVVGRGGFSITWDKGCGVKLWPDPLRLLGQEDSIQLQELRGAENCRGCMGGVWQDGTWHPPILRSLCKAGLWEHEPRTQQLYVPQPISQQ